MENSRAAEKIGDKVLAIICNHSSRYPTDSQYLVQYNDDENWCFPGGCIRLAESSGQAVYREIQEQYGLELEHFWRPILHQNKSLEKQSTRNPVTGACDFLQRNLTSPDFSLVLLALISLSDFYFQKVTRTPPLLSSKCVE